MKEKERFRTVRLMCKPIRKCCPVASIDYENKQVVLNDEDQIGMSFKLNFDHVRSLFEEINGK